MPTKKGSRRWSPRDVEDEFVYQNSIRLNSQFYASLGDKRAFVISHARNLIILKIVGFAEAAVQYYRMATRGPTSGSPTSATRPRAACGIPAGPTRSSG